MNNYSKNKHCNTRANFNRSYWQEIYKNKILLENTKDNS